MDYKQAANIDEKMIGVENKEAKEGWRILIFYKP